MNEHLLSTFVKQVVCSKPWISIKKIILTKIKTGSIVT